MNRPKRSSEFFSLAGLAILIVLLLACSESKPQPADMDALKKTVIANVESIARCYQSGAAENPSLAGKIAVSVRVSANGVSEEVRLGENALGDKVGKCIVQVFRKIRFPRITKDTWLEESFCFEPDPDGQTCKR